MSEYTAEECHFVVRKALDELIARDAVLISEKANEQSLTFRLGMYLQRLMFDMDVDCEYNRVGTAGNSKWLYVGNIRPDVIVHRRGTAENLIIIEAKKNSCMNMKSRTFDLERLEKMTNQSEDYSYHYQVGYFVDFIVGPRGCSYSQTWLPPIKVPSDVHEIRVEERR